MRSEETTSKDALRTRRAVANPRRYVEASGERIALFGDEWGTFEVWAWPFKLLEGLRVDLERAEEPLGPWALSRRVEVTPAGFAFLLEGAGVRVRQEVFALRERAGLAFVTRYLEGPAPLDVAARFRCDLRAQWPAGLGGEIARRDPHTGCLCLTEERGRFAALLGGPGFVLDAEFGDHATPTETVRLAAPIAPGEARVLVVTASTAPPEALPEEARLGRGQAATGFARSARNVAAARALQRELASDHEALAESERARWQAFERRVPRLSTDDARLDDAYAWALTAIERAWIEVDGLGRGLVAGIGPSRGGARPGYAWFFDGDALVAARALSRAGEHASVRAILRFAASHQREDGKLMHELTLAANLCPWLEEYPYAYYKGLNAADFVVTLCDHVAISGDVELADELWDTTIRALRWCRSTVGPDGLMQNAEAGIAAVEAGPLSDAIASEVFLNGTYLAALVAAVALARSLERPEAAQELERWRDDAADGLEALFDEGTGAYAFGRLHDGSLLTARTAYHGVLLERELGTPARRLETAQRLASPRLLTDWGARMFATDAEAYDPEHYNTGAVFPYLTGFCVRGFFRAGLSEAALQLLSEQAGLTHFGALGFLEEHLVGDVSRVPARGVPHQIFSSSQIVESVHAGLFGLRERAQECGLEVAPQLPAGWRRASLERLRVGETVLDLELTREREPGVTRTTLELRIRSGPPLVLHFAPWLPPHTLGTGVPPSVARDGGEPVPCPTRFERTESGALRLPLSPQEVTRSLRIGLELCEGPSLELPLPALAPDAPPRNARVVERTVVGDTGVGDAVVGDAVVYRLAAPAGSRQDVRLFGDREVVGDEGRGSGERTFSLEFPAAPAAGEARQGGRGAEWTERVLRLELAPAPPRA